MSAILIGRHGETTWNAVGRYQGRLETPLSPLGQAQAQILAASLRDAGLQRILSSPLSRCVQTVLPLSMQTGIPIETDPLLTEIAHGSWEGRYRDEIARTEPELYRRWHEQPESVRFDGGESLDDVLARWKAFARSLDASKNTFIMTHDIVVRVAVLAQTGRPVSELRTVHCSNAAYARFTVDDGLWTLQAECESAHLRGLDADLGRQAL